MTLGIHQQRAGDADPLVHAAGQLGGMVVLEAAQADEIDELHGAIIPLGLADALELEVEGDVVDRRQPRHQGRLLEHHAAVRARPLHLLAVDQRPPGSRLLEAGDDVEQGRLAAAGRAEQADEIIGLDVEIDVVQRQQVAAAPLVGKHLDDVAKLDRRHQPALPCTVVVCCQRSVRAMIALRPRSER